MNTQTGGDYRLKGGTLVTRRDLIDYCLTLPAAYEDYPFDETWAVMRHASNKKSFAFIYEKAGALQINLKCEPAWADFYRSVYQDVTPGYHMNKQHWNTILIGGDVGDDWVKTFINQSYDLIKPKARAKKPEHGASGG